MEVRSADSGRVVKKALVQFSGRTRGSSSLLNLDQFDGAGAGGTGAVQWLGADCRRMNDLWDLWPATF